jgi:exosortase/archaeosortase family protein
MGITAPGNFYSSFLDNNLNYVRAFRHFLIAATAGLLRMQGYQVSTSDTFLHAYNVGGFNMVYSCLGFGIMSFFIAFVIAYPKSIKSKIIFAPIGLVIIQCLNISRLYLLTLYWRQSIFVGNINHHTLFNIVLYLMLLIMIYVWINISDKKTNPLKSVSRNPF